MRAWRVAALLAALLAGSQPPRAATPETPLADYAVAGDSVPAPLDGKVGDPVRGRRIVIDRETGNCLICHKVPEPEERFQGDLGPDLSGVGGRLSERQLRLRLIDQSRLNPRTIMPPYYRISELHGVAGKWRGRPVLDAQAIEDVVAYLATLK